MPLKTLNCPIITRTGPRSANPEMAARLGFRIQSRVISAAKLNYIKNAAP
jgi:hypothetical protein